MTPQAEILRRRVRRMPGRLWRHPGVVIAALSAVVAAAAFAFTGYDETLSDWARARNATGQYVLDLHYLWGAPHGPILVALCLGAVGRRRTGMQILLALLVVVAVALPMKLILFRIRPLEGPFSFPSADTATAAVLIAPLLLWSRWTLPLTAFAVFGVASRRVMMGYHWPSDVLAGFAIGLAAGAAARALLPRSNGPGRAWWLVAAVAWAACMGLGVLGSASKTGQFLGLYGPTIALLVTAAWVKVLAATETADRLAAWVREHPAKAVTLVAAGVVVGYALLAAQASLWDRDEPRYVRATIEMMESGDALVPTFLGRWRLYKPAGIYWLMAGGAALLGKTELAFRLPSLLAAAASVLVLYRIGRRVCGRGPALWAGLVLAGCTQVLIAGTLAITDAVLLLTVTAGIAMFVGDMMAGPTWRRAAGMGLALGAALLIKGPVGPVEVGLTIAGTWLLARGTLQLDRRYLLRLLAAATLGTALFLAWAIPANIATDGEFARFGLGRHVGHRLVEPMEGHGGNFWLYLPYYIPVVAVGLFPWVGLLPAAASATLSARLPGGRVARALVLGWVLPTFVLMSLVATKLPHYILPVFPGLALAIGGTIAVGPGLDPRDSRWLVHGGRLLAGLAIAGGVGLTLGPTVLFLAGEVPYPPVMQQLNPAGLATGLVLLVMPLALRNLGGAARLRSRAVVLAASLVAFCVALGAVALPEIEKLKPTKHLAEQINRVAPRGAEIACCRFDEGSLHVYLDRAPRRLLGVGAVPAWAAEPGPGVLVIPAFRLEQVRRRTDEPLDLIEVGRAYGLNYAKGEWIELLALGRDLPIAERRPREAQTRATRQPRR